MTSVCKMRSPELISASLIRGSLRCLRKMLYAARV